MQKARHRVASTGKKVMIAGRVLTIKQAASNWTDHLQNRRRRPAKQSSIAVFRSYLDRWVLPCLGDYKVSSVGVAVLRDFIGQLDEAGLSAKSQVEISGVVKQIIAHCTDSEGEPLFPRRWDNERLDLPIVNRAEQYTPIVSREQIESAIAKSKPANQCLFALAAGAGLRCGELLSIKLVEDGVSTVFDSSAATIRVRRSMWRGQETSTKTQAGARSVEIPRVLSDFISSFAGDRQGFLFGNGTSLSASTARAALNIAVGEGIGWHAFRRYFVSFRRSQGMPEDILKRLVGHSSGGDITSLYNRFGNLSADRREWVERIGLGFDLPRGAA